MINKISFLKLLIALSIFGFGIFANAVEIACPESIKVAQKFEKTQESNWEGFEISTTNLRHFYAVSFSEGPPTDRVFLTASKITSSKIKKSDIYTFSDDIKGPLWISCQYIDTSVVVARIVIEPHQYCEVTYDKLTAFASVKRVECR